MVQNFVNMNREYYPSQSMSHFETQISQAEGIISPVDLDVDRCTLTRGILRMRQQQKIVDEIRRVEASLYDLRTRYNEFSLISSLPFDVFDRIFTILTWDDPPRNSDLKSKGRTSLGWINVTHVCTHWRNIAIENTALWTEVDSTLGLTWMRAMMERAGQRPVIFRAKIPHTVDSPFPDILPCVKSGLSRIKHLELECLDFIFSDYLRLLSSPAPVLSSMDLRSALFLRNDGTWHTMSELPANIFSGCTPNLRKLCVTGVNISWASPVLLGLTELSIRYSVSIASVVINRYSQILDALENMPALEKLCLHNALPAPSALDIPRRVCLSRLRFLSLKDEITTCSSFFHHFELTAAVAVDITLNTSGEDGAEQHLLSLLHEDVRSVEGESATATALEFSQLSKNRRAETTIQTFYGQHTFAEEGNVVSSMGSVIASPSSFQALPPFPPRTITLIHMPPQILVMITNAIFARPASIALRALILHKMQVLDVMPHEQFFGRAPNCEEVESVKISVTALRAFLNYLDSRHTVPDGQASDSWHFPSLRNLTIEGDFSSHVPPSRHRESTLLSHLRGIVERRRKGAVPFRSLELIDTSEVEHELYLEPLEKLIPAVTYRLSR